MSAIVKAIYLRPERGADPVSVESVKAVIGTGLEGDHFKKDGGLRQVTLLSQQAWDEVCQDLGQELDPILRRSNILIDGLDFKKTKGRILKIGHVVISIEGETRPCKIMDETYEGLKDALVPEWRGGAYGKVLSGGIIKVGEKAFWSTGL